MPNSKTIAYKKGYKYQLAEIYRLFDMALSFDLDFDETIKSDFIILDEGVLTIKPGYAWDGATGAIDTDNFMRASLVHDALYQLMRENKLNRKFRKTVDRLLKQLCLEDGMSRFRANYVYHTVRLTAAYAVQPNQRHLIHYSPLNHPKTNSKGETP